MSHMGLEVAPGVTGLLSQVVGRLMAGMETTLTGRWNLVAARHRVR